MATLINQDGTDKNDVLTYDKGGEGVVYHTMAGNDKVTIAGDSIALVNDAGSDTITITGGSAHTIEGNGASVETIIIDGGAAVSAELGDGRDVVTINKSSGRTSTGASSSIRGGGWTDTFNIKEGAQNYQLYGEAGDDIFNIDGGKNMNFWGGAANDTFVVTGGSNNKLYGGDSDDVFEISAANQNMILGYGKDTVNIKAGDNQQIKGNLGINSINLLAGSGHVITSDIDQVASKKAGKDVGYGVDKVIIDGASQVTANLGDGKDVVEIKTGSGHMIYTEGWGDTVTISGTASNSVIDTGAGDDIVIINGGTNNTIVVGEGNDTITLNDGSVGVLNGESGTNTITVNGGSVESVIGAFVQVGATAGNKITITGGNITGEEIIGSTNASGGDIEGNIITITGGSFGKNAEGQAITSVYGGRSSNGDMIYNQVSVSAGDFAKIYGGYQEGNQADGLNNTIGNQVLVEGSATAAEVYGGIGPVKAANNEVTIAGQAKVGRAVGGYTTLGGADKNVVTVKGEAVVGQVIGGISDIGSAFSSQVLITENATVDSVIGSYAQSNGKYSNLGAGNNVTLAGKALVKGDVYCLYIDNADPYQRANTVSITENAVVNGSVIGTYGKDYGVNDMNIYVTGGSVANYKASKDTLITGESGYIIGLKSDADKYISGANVNMSAGEVAVLCGAIGMGKSNIGSIQVTLSGGSVAAVDGAYSESGMIAGVFVNVTGGKIVSDIEGLEAHVLGGRTRTGEIGFTNVSITDMDQSELQVISGQAVNGNDGEMLSGKLSGTTANINNSTIQMVTGGQNLGLGNVQGATVTVDNSRVSAELATADFAKLEDQLDYAVVGGVGQGQEVAGNRVQVIGGQVSAVYGGVNKGEQGISDSNNVVLNNGVIVNNNVYGGISVGGTVRSCGITINEANIMGYDAVFGDGGHAVGAYSQSGLVTTNGIYMAKGEVHRLTGGGSETGTVTENGVTLNTGCTVAIAEGGYSESGQVVKNNVTTRGGTVTDAVYAGRVIENSADSDIKAVVNGNKADLVGSELKDVYGGMAVESGNVTNNTVSIRAATVKGSVWGGYTASGSAYNNSVSIYDSVIEGNVYSSVGTVENPSSIIAGEDNLIIVGADRMGDIMITGNTSQVKGTIYGGYGIDTINLYGCTINAIDGGAGNDTITAQGATVGTIDGGAGDDIIGINGETVNSITGGEGNDTIHLSACDVALVYAGAGNDIITVNEAESVRITGGTGSDTYKFESLKDDTSYIVNEKGASKDERETFDLTNYNEEDITISYSGSDMKLKAENGATITIKNYSDLYHMMIYFKDSALGFEKRDPYYTTEENQVMVFGSK